jgi:hypothetical protein
MEGDAAGPEPLETDVFRVAAPRATPSSREARPRHTGTTYLVVGAVFLFAAVAAFLVVLALLAGTR